MQTAARYDRGCQASTLGVRGDDRCQSIIDQLRLLDELIGERASVIEDRLLVALALRLLSGRQALTSLGYGDSEVANFRAHPLRVATQFGQALPRSGIVLSCTIYNRPDRGVDLLSNRTRREITQLEVENNPASQRNRNIGGRSGRGGCFIGRQISFR